MTTGAVGRAHTEVTDGPAVGEEVVLADLKQPLVPDDEGQSNGLTGLGETGSGSEQGRFTDRGFQPPQVAARPDDDVASEQSKHDGPKTERSSAPPWLAPVEKALAPDGSISYVQRRDLQPQGAVAKPCRPIAPRQLNCSPTTTRRRLGRFGVSSEVGLVEGVVHMTAARRTDRSLE